MMLDVNSARMRAHRNNIGRYRRLLETNLTDRERLFIERRLGEEEAALEARAAAFSFTITPLGNVVLAGMGGAP